MPEYPAIKKRIVYVIYKVILLLVINADKETAYKIIK